MIYSVVKLNTSELLFVLENVLSIGFCLNNALEGHMKNLQVIRINVSHIMEGIINGPIAIAFVTVLSPTSNVAQGKCIPLLPHVHKTLSPLN